MNKLNHIQRGRVLTSQGQGRVFVLPAVFVMKMLGCESY